MSRKRTLALPKGKKTFASGSLVSGQLCQFEKEILKIHCHICGFDISKMDFIDRNLHVNSCVDKSCGVNLKTVTVTAMDDANDTDFVGIDRAKDMSTQLTVKDMPTQLIELDADDDLELACAISLSFNDIDAQANDQNLQRPRKQRMRQQSIPSILNKTTVPTKSNLPNFKNSTLFDVEELLMRNRYQLNEIEERIAEEEYRKLQINKELKKLMKKQLQLESEERKRLGQLCSTSSFSEATSLEDMLKRVFDTSASDSRTRHNVGSRATSTRSLCPFWSLAQMKDSFDNSATVSALLELPVSVPSEDFRTSSHPYFSNRVAESKEVLVGDMSKSDCGKGGISQETTVSSKRLHVGDMQHSAEHSPSALSQLLSALDGESQSHNCIYETTGTGDVIGKPRNSDSDENLCSDDWCLDTIMKCVDSLRRRYCKMTTDENSMGRAQRIRCLLDNMETIAMGLAKETLSGLDADERRSNVEVSTYGCEEEDIPRDRERESDECSPKEEDVICLDLDELIPDTPQQQSKEEKGHLLSGPTITVAGVSGDIEEISLAYRHQSSPSTSLHGRKRSHGHLDMLSENLSQSQFLSNDPSFVHFEGAIMTNAKSSHKSSRRFSSTASLASALTPHSISAEKSICSVASSGSHVLSVWAGAAESRVFDSPGDPISGDGSAEGSSPRDSPCLFTMHTVSGPPIPLRGNGSLDAPAQALTREAPSGSHEGSSASFSTTYHADSFDDGLVGIVHYYGPDPTSPSDLTPIASQVSRRESFEVTSESNGVDRRVGCLTVKTELSEGAAMVVRESDPMVDQVIQLPAEPAIISVPMTTQTQSPLLEESRISSGPSAVRFLASNEIAENSGPRRFDIITMSTRPDFSEYTIDELRRICKSYGLKQSESRKFMSKILTSVWERSQAGNRGNGVGAQISAVINEPTSGDESRRENSGNRLNSCASDKCGDTESITELSTVVLDYIRNYDVDMYEKVLSFQPLNIDEVRTKLVQHGVKISKTMLRDIFDKEGIFVCCI